MENISPTNTLPKIITGPSVDDLQRVTAVVESAIRFVKRIELTGAEAMECARVLEFLENMLQGARDQILNAKPAEQKNA